MQVSHISLSMLLYSFNSFSVNIQAVCFNIDWTFSCNQAYLIVKKLTLDIPNAILLQT